MTCNIHRTPQKPINTYRSRENHVTGIELVTLRLTSCDRNRTCDLEVSSLTLAPPMWEVLRSGALIDFGGAGGVGRVLTRAGTQRIFRASKGYVASHLHTPITIFRPYALFPGPMEDSRGSPGRFCQCCFPSISQPTFPPGFWDQERWEGGVEKCIYSH
jgi:hypothetical protein